MKIPAVLLIAAALGASALAIADEPAAKPAAPAAAAAPASGAKPAAPANGPLTDAQASYRVGLSLGEQLAQIGISSEGIKPEEVSRGVRDALRGAKLTPEDGKGLNEWVMAARDSAGKRNVAAAQKFLANNGKLPGVVTTASGLEYKVVTPGTGASPKPTDEVKVHYRGTLLNGSEFDSSYKRNEPAVFPVNGVIKGWQEALVLMQPGAKWKLFIPPALAYDMNPKPGIPPGSALVFDVELLSVTPKP
ncbi:MAG: FKBP-type peptidyl-prolyl cis-trans isomerase [Steroidobacteraceae bacterium]